MNSAPKYRKLRRVLWFFGALLFALFLGLRWLEPQLLFYPRTAAQDWVPISRDFEEITLSNRTSALWCPLSESQIVVLYCHGNYGNLSMREDWIRAMQRHLRTSVLIFDPPGYGKTPGQPSEKGCYNSAEAAFGWLETQGWKDEQIVLWGKSLGGGMATEMALRHPKIRALILLDTFSSVPDAANVSLGVPVGFVARNRFDNAAKVGKIGAPKIIIGGENDTMCPPWMTRKLSEAALEPKSVRVLRGRNHADPLGETDWKWLSNELRRLSASNHEI